VFYSISCAVCSDTPEEVPKKAKSNSSSSKGTSLITSELSVCLENSFPVLPTCKSNPTNASEVPVVKAKKTVTTPAKPVTRSTRYGNCAREEVKSTRSHSARSTEVPKKHSEEVPVRSTRSGSALLNDRTRNSSIENKREEVTVTK
jgi:hypothetical protein